MLYESPYRSQFQEIDRSPEFKASLERIGHLLRQPALSTGEFSELKELIDEQEARYGSVVPFKNPYEIQGADDSVIEVRIRYLLRLDTLPKDKLEELSALLAIKERNRRSVSFYYEREGHTTGFERTQQLLGELAMSHFDGSLELKFEAGSVVLIHKTETLDPGKPRLRQL